MIVGRKAGAKPGTELGKGDVDKTKQWRLLRTDRRRRTAEDPFGKDTVDKVFDSHCVDLTQDLPVVRRSEIP